MKNYQTPRTFSDAQFQTGYPSVRQTPSRSRWWLTYSGWIAFILLLLAVSSGGVK